MSTWNGKTLGNVVIGNLIARGGMAEVYSGNHATLKRDVAVKIMRDHVEEDPDSRARFAREARVVASLSHPNIIQIFDYDLIDGRPCIVMELITGAPLSNYLKALQKRGEKLPAETIARLLSAIASAVDYAHARQIVHRDIKPANILLRNKGGNLDLEAPLPEDAEPVLTDFGLVRLLDASTQTSTGTVSGTPSYMSPEQARGDRVDHRTDIYSLGVVLYELLAGNVPFDAESSFGVLMKHLNEPPPPIPGISANMQAIINRALAKNPAHRFESAGDMAAEFKAVAEGKPLSKRTEQVNTLLETEPKQNQPPVAPASALSRLPLLIGGFVILAALAFGVFWLLRTPAVQTEPQDPNLPVGRIRFDDFNYQLDEVTVTINGLPVPAEGWHYDVWLVSQNGQRRNMGRANFEGTNAVLSHRDPGKNNLLEAYDQIEVTLEPGDDPDPDQPNGEVVASSVFPPGAFNSIRHLLVSVGITPNGKPLIQGMWFTVDTVDTSVIELREAFMGEDEAGVRLKTEEIINQLAGDGNPDLYKDWNDDGNVEDYTDGFGLLPNPNRSGYIITTLETIKQALESPDATRNIRENSENLRVCIRNVEESGRRILDLALMLQNMPYGAGMEATIAEMEAASVRMLSGEDADNNGRIDPLPAECGADSVYEIGYTLAEFPLLPGVSRVPPPAGSIPGATNP